MKKLLLIGAILASVFVFTACQSSYTATSSPVVNPHNVILRNNITYRPILEISKERVCEVGDAADDESNFINEISSITNIDAKTFDRLTNTQKLH